MTKPPAPIVCDVTFTAITSILWEASCPCGFWVRGRKIDCERAANGHKPNAD